jgi:hypothetical protein
VAPASFPRNVSVLPRFPRMAAACLLADLGVARVQDLSGRPHLSYDLVFPTERIGTYETQVRFTVCRTALSDLRSPPPHFGDPCCLVRLSGVRALPLPADGPPSPRPCGCSWWSTSSSRWSTPPV